MMLYDMRMSSSFLFICILKFWGISNPSMSLVPKPASYDPSVGNTKNNIALMKDSYHAMTWKEYLMMTFISLIVGLYVGFFATRKLPGAKVERFLMAAFCAILVFFETFIFGTHLNNVYFWTNAVNSEVSVCLIFALSVFFITGAIPGLVFLKANWNTRVYLLSGLLTCVLFVDFITSALCSGSGQIFWGNSFALFLTGLIFFVLETDREVYWFLSGMTVAGIAGFAHAIIFMLYSYFIPLWQTFIDNPKYKDAFTEQRKVGIRNAVTIGVCGFVPLFLMPLFDYAFVQTPAEESDNEYYEEVSYTTAGSGSSRRSGSKHTSSGRSGRSKTGSSYRRREEEEGEYYEDGQYHEEEEYYDEEGEAADHLAPLASDMRREIDEELM